MDSDVKERIAKQSAKLFLTQLAGVPADVQLMAIDILIRVIFTTSIAQPKRLQILDTWLKGIRTGVQAEGKKK